MDEFSAGEVEFGVILKDLIILNNFLAFWTVRKQGLGPVPIRLGTAWDLSQSGVVPIEISPNPDSEKSQLVPILIGRNLYWSQSELGQLTICPNPDWDKSQSFVPDCPECSKIVQNNQNPSRLLGLRIGQNESQSNSRTIPDPAASSKSIK